MSCVDEHTNDRYDHVPVFQMEVLNGEKCAKTLMIVGLVHTVMNVCRERDDAKVSLCSPTELNVLNPGPVEQEMFDEERFTMQRVPARNEHV